jgi:HSP20 family protein
MANIARYNPLGELLTRESPFGDLFSDISRDVLNPLRLLDRPQELGIRLDVSEDEKAYYVQAEVPGAKRDDIKVSVNGNHVSISAEFKKQREEKQSERTLRRERYYGNAYRSFTLDREIEDSEVQAKYVEGVLNLTLPKKQSKVGKQIQIS